ncbi:MAG: leucine dehydrogenase [Cyclobacteriaceae bacterium]|nr:leucine dehydrogenase [Cyclobacteriaceae bacterium]
MEINQLETAQDVSIMEEIAKFNHEQVVFCNDNHTGLKAIIAIHNTVLGPGLGGTRMWQYASDKEALTDALRLSRGMTYKAAVTGLNIGGGKAVIMGDARKDKTEAFLRRFGKFIESLNGKYVTAEDVNMTTRDMEYIAMETNHVTGLSKSLGGSGDPSPVTAYGTYVGIKAMCKKVYGSEDLSNRKVAVQGVGQVGMYLTEYLRKENATVYITDINEEKVKKVVESTGAKPVGMDAIYDLDTDVYAPCALGATINDLTIPRLKCKIIAGAANNQLKDEIKHGYDLMDREIVYAPDFVINAGGLINVYLDHLKEYNAERAHHMAEKIYDNCLNVVENAEKQGISPQEAAMLLGDKRIEEVGRLKVSF